MAAASPGAARRTAKGAARLGRHAAQDSHHVLGREQRVRRVEAAPRPRDAGTSAFGRGVSVRAPPRAAPAARRGRAVPGGQARRPPILETISEANRRFSEIPVRRSMLQVTSEAPPSLATRCNQCLVRIPARSRQRKDPDRPDFTTTELEAQKVIVMQTDSPQRKLTLHKETLRRLDVDELRLTKGGAMGSIPKARSSGTRPYPQPPFTSRVVYSFAGAPC